MNKNNDESTLKGLQLANQIGLDMVRGNNQLRFNLFMVAVCLPIAFVQTEIELLVASLVLLSYFVWQAYETRRNLKSMSRVSHFRVLVKGKGERLEDFLERNSFNRNEAICIERYLEDEPEREMIALELVQIILSCSPRDFQSRNRAHQKTRAAVASLKKVRSESPEVSESCE